MLTYFTFFTLLKIAFFTFLWMQKGLQLLTIVIVIFDVGVIL